jgi:hypothetical protein
MSVGAIFTMVDDKEICSPDSDKEFYEVCIMRIEQAGERRAEMAIHFPQRSEESGQDPRFDISEG